MDGDSSIHVSMALGKGNTLDSVEKLLSTVKNSQAKYVIAIFLDIQVAFDIVWWPRFMNVIRESQVSSNVYNILRDYLSEREAIWERGGKVR